MISKPEWTSKPTWAVWDIETGPSPDEELARIQAATSKELPKDKLALSPVTGRILAIGLWVERHRSPMIFENFDGTNEAGLINDFLKMVNRLPMLHLVGFNTLGFDLPFIFRRAWAHNIQEVWTLDAVWQHDLMQVWRECDRTGESDRIGLNMLAAHLGLDIYKAGRGADFATTAIEDPAAARNYLRRDLEVTMQCAERMIPGFPVLYREETPIIN